MRSGPKLQSGTANGSQPVFAELHECTRCPRLAAALQAVRKEQPQYFAKPVPPFGDSAPKLLIVGLAPGLNGANRTGRPFTGDYAGELLYATLYRYGWSNRAVAVDPRDGLKLAACRITNAVKCWPPENKPTPAEVKTCNTYLAQELVALEPYSALLALGQIAHNAVLSALGAKRSQFGFGHGAQHDLPNDVRLFDSYHCSRYNTQTRRLTTEMFEAIFESIAHYLRRDETHVRAAR